MLQSQGKKIPKLYTINVRDVEYLKDFKNYSTLKFEQINRIKDKSVVIVEDIITLNAKEESQLRLLLNWYAHHKRLKFFCVSHNIFKTKLFNTIGYFHFVVFTSSLSNLRIIKNCLNYFQLDGDVWQNWQTKI